MSKPPHYHYSNLSDLLSKQPGPRLSVCIVTPDLLGPVKNGGVGTACTYLAYTLAEAGHQVDMLFSQCGCDSKDDATWIQNYTTRGINVSIAHAWDAARGSISYFPNHAPLHMALVVHDWLAAQGEVDLVIFMEWQGHGFYAMHAKQCGLHFQNTVMTVVTHSPSFWHSTNNATMQFNPIESCTWHMERCCIEMADAVISPSDYMLDWCREHGYKIPKLAIVQQNLLKWDISLRHDSDNKIEELVFFGRLEYRKGLEQFCAALDILAKQKKLPKRVTFLGKCAWMGEEHSVLYVARRAKVWKSCVVSLKLHYDHVQAVQYLCGKGRMAVMPSVADNSPYSVYECLVAGIPFVARAVGGVAELIAPEDHDAVLFDDNPQELALKLRGILGKPPNRSTLRFDPSVNTKAWCEGLPQLVALCRNRDTPPPALPFISVCLTHYNRPHLLRQAVDSLLAQDYPHFEVILADDGSTDAEAITFLNALEPIFSSKGWRILRLANGFPAKARNIAARLAKGQWLLFFDDDNVAMPCMLHRFAQAAQTRKSGLITSMFNVFEGAGAPSPKQQRERFLPTGNMVAYSVMDNTLGDTTSLLFRKTFERAGGFGEDYGLGHEDFELFLRIVLLGEPVGVIPEPLFWYRKAKEKSSVQLNTNFAANRMRSLRPFIEMWPAPLGELALMAHGLANTEYVRSTHVSDNGENALNIADGIYADPQSDTMLIRVVNILAQNGQQQFADEVLGSLQEATISLSAQMHELCMRARQAASEGNVAKLQDCLEISEKEFLESTAPYTSQVRCGFYALLLHCMPTNEKMNKIRRKILDYLKLQDDDSIDTSLIISKHSTITANRDDAAVYFCKALQKAENLYLELRKDVAHAIDNGIFVCALQHYALHGKADKTDWPKKHFFSEILNNNPLVISAACKTYLQTYQHMDDFTIQAITLCLQENI